VSHNDKHNEANGEDNRDGTDNNRSWNCGIEGPSKDPKIKALRARQKRNLLATLLLSQGVPMIVAGDEMGRTQLGNNNPYCQDNAISWIDWDVSEDDIDLFEFARRLISVRRQHPIFRRRNFFQGRSIRGTEVKDILWLKPDGTEMTDEEWDHSFARSLGVYLSGSAMDERDRQGRQIRDDHFLLLFNAHHEPMDFRMPDLGEDRGWHMLLDTSHAGGLQAGGYLRAGEPYPLEGRSIAVLRQRNAS